MSDFELLAQLLDLLLELGDPRANRVDVLAARRSVGHEAGAVVDRVDRHRLGRDADDGRARRDVLGHDRIGADLRAFADLDRAEHLRARADHHAVAERRVALAADAGGRVGAAERDMLVDGDVVADLGAFADHAEAVIEEEALADLGAGMDVDRRSGSARNG